MAHGRFCIYSNSSGFGKIRVVRHRQKLSCITCLIKSFSIVFHLPGKCRWLCQWRPVPKPAEGSWLLLRGYNYHRAWQAAWLWGKGIILAKLKMIFTQAFSSHETCFWIKKIYIVACHLSKAPSFCRREDISGGLILPRVHLFPTI